MTVVLVVVLVVLVVAEVFVVIVGARRLGGALARVFRGTARAYLDRLDQDETP